MQGRETFNVSSNSSPLEAIDLASAELIEPDSRTSIFVFSDELTIPEVDPALIIGPLDQSAPDTRVHTRMFTAILTSDAEYRGSAHRLAATMLEVAEATGGTFEIVGGVTLPQEEPGGN